MTGTTVEFPERLTLAGRRGFDPERWSGAPAVMRPDCVALHQGDPCFPTPPHIVKAGFEAVAQGYTHYPNPAGDPALREALAERMNEVATRSFTVDDVLVTVGATQAIYCALTAYLGPGDEALLFDPVYSLYAPIVRQAGGEPVYVGLTDDFRIDSASLEAALTERTRMIIVNNPVNPTGVVLGRGDLEAIAAAAHATDALVVADEVYDRLVFDGDFVSTLELDELAERLLYVNSFSKTYAMTGWRLGWVAGPADLVLGAQIIHRNCVGTVNWPTQRAGLAALCGSQDVVTAMVDGYRHRRDVLLEGLHGTPGLEAGKPMGTFYAFVRFPPQRGLTSELVALRLRESGVVVRSGTEYGSAGEGFLRISFAASLKDVELGASRMRAVLDGLGKDGS